MKFIPTMQRSPMRECWGAAFLGACVLLAASSVRADTIFLKDGTQILDCKVKEETATHVYLQTPVGDMGVPQSQIYRIVRTRTNHDTYKEQLASIRGGDVNGLFKLAQWCRSSSGLRKESDELTELRLKKIEEEFRKKERDKKVGKAVAPKA